MEKINVLSRTKEDYNNLDSFLMKNNLVDENGIWFAGYNDIRRGSINAVAANIFYGYKKLMVISVFENTIFMLKNSKKGFIVYELAKVSENNKVAMRRHIIYPTVEIYTEHGDSILIKVIKNKSVIKAFKKLVK